MCMCCTTASRSIHRRSNDDFIYKAVEKNVVSDFQAHSCKTPYSCWRHGAKYVYCCTPAVRSTEERLSVGNVFVTEATMPTITVIDKMRVFLLYSNQTLCVFRGQKQRKK